MSRPIKFRAWDAGEGKMYTMPTFSEDFSLIALSQWFRLTSTRLIHKNVTLMQFTGLTDKHGTEIYEGDWLSWDEDVYEVRYLRGEWVLFHTSDDDYDRPSLASIIKPSGDNVEILGNIYEHPHLLVNPTSATGGG